MEATKQFSLGFTKIEQNATPEQCYFEKDIKNIQKVILQSFKYCQAKNSKNKYLKQKRVEQIKKYQRQLVGLIKKKSEQIIQDLVNHSQKMIQQEQSILDNSQKNQNETLLKLQQKIQMLKNQESFSPQPILDLQKIKKITLQCQEQLQRMQGKFSNINERLEQQIVDQMEKPFKSFLKCLNLFKKQIKKTIIQNQQ